MGRDQKQQITLLCLLVPEGRQAFSLYGVRIGVCSVVGLEWWHRWFAHSLCNVECKVHVQCPAFALTPSFCSSSLEAVASLVAQLVKNLPSRQETRVRSLGREGIWNPTDCSLPGSFVHGIIPARILGWVAFPSPEDLPDPGIELASLTSPALAGGFFTVWATREVFRCGVFQVFLQYRHIYNPYR